jgi:hypothetical protein
MNRLTEQLDNKFTDAKLHDPGHRYIVKGQEFKPVSTQLKNFYTPFDKSIAKWVAKREGLTTNQVLEQWEIKAHNARNKGTRVHSFAELYGLGIAEREAAAHIQEKAVIQWYDNMPEDYYPIAFEQLLYWEEEKIAGTCDLILYHKPTGSLILADWKTNETDLFYVYDHRYLLPPFEDIEDCQYTKYELQLSYYRAMLKLAGFKTGPSLLVWLMPNGDKLYNSRVTRDFSDKIIKYHHDTRRGSIQDSIGIL